MTRVDGDSISSAQCRVDQPGKIGIEGLEGHVEIIPGAPYPIYRLAIIATGLAVAFSLYYLIARTRAGMLIRAGASNRAMVAALGVNIRLLFTGIFGLGAALAGLSGSTQGMVRMGTTPTAGSTPVPALGRGFGLLAAAGVILGFGLVSRLSRRRRA